MINAIVACGFGLTQISLTVFARLVENLTDDSVGVLWVFVVFVVWAHTDPADLTVFARLV